jgi:hypothetical protein
LPLYTEKNKKVTAISKYFCIFAENILGDEEKPADIKPVMLCFFCCIFATEKGFHGGHLSL